MPRKITPATTLDNLKKEAKRWLKALRENDAEALQRFHDPWPTAPDQPVLRDVQYALAREYDQKSWTELKQTLAGRAPEEPRNQEQAVARFLEYACPDHHVRSLSAHRMAARGHARPGAESRDRARQHIYTSVVCGEIEEVDRLLTEHPELVHTKRPVTGQYVPAPEAVTTSWENLAANMGALLYLLFTRLPLAKANDHALAIARLLLDRGADPNAVLPWLATAATHR